MYSVGEAGNVAVWLCCVCFVRVTLVHEVSTPEDVCYGCLQAKIKNLITVFLSRDVIEARDTFHIFS